MILFFNLLFIKYFCICLFLISNTIFITNASFFRCINKGSGAHTNRPPQSVSPHASAAGAHPAAFEAPVKRAYRRPPISEEEMWTIQVCSVHQKKKKKSLSFRYTIHLTTECFSLVAQNGTHLLHRRMLHQRRGDKRCNGLIFFFLRKQRKRF